MANTADPLSALQAIRLPDVPASSLWEQMAVAVFTGVVLAIIIQLAISFRKRKSRVHLEQNFIIAIKDTENLPDEERLTAQATVIRHYVNIVAGDVAARKQGEEWLEELDNLFKTEFFRKGSGRALLDDLYLKQSASQAAGLGMALCQLLQGRKL